MTEYIVVYMVCLTLLSGIHDLFEVREAGCDG